MRQRLCTAIALLPLLVAASATAQARNYLTSDGQFTVCAWGSLDNCTLLDAKKEAAMGLTALEQRTLTDLRRFAAATAFTTQQLSDAFGPPSQSVKTFDDADMLIWSFYPSAQGQPKSAIGMSIVDKQLAVIRYIVPGKFDVHWYVND